MSAEQLQRLSAALTDRYRVIRVIGRGGMATVYLAEDPRHRRDVAIKVFHPDLDIIGSERFLREIEVTAGLTHPNILPLHDSGIADGLLYYVMPYVQGESLRDRLSRLGRLPLEDAVRISREVAGALGFAHRRGIVHRDIKPENILLQEGHAFVADFGIARAAGLTGDMVLTRTGIAVGTPAYMSPEQVAGDSSLDGRSDIYSLGCVLFEAVCGSPPFTGATAAAIAITKFTEPAPRLQASHPEVPAAVDDAVAKALARDPEDRFATAEDFVTALTLHSTSPRQEVNGLVVLPFTNLSPDPENEFFADGLMEEVIADLSAIRALRVISRTSAMCFKASDKDIRAIARELKVRYVLEGSVRRAGQSLRVTAQLIDAENDSHLWADKYSGGMQDVFAIQEEISLKIVHALRLRLTEGEARVVAERPIDNPAAYDCYLRACHEMYVFTPDALERAHKLVDDGLAIIGENALLLATKGLVFWMYVNFSVRPEEQYLAEAEASAVRALDQDSENYLGIFVRGVCAAKRGDLEGAIRDIRLALERRPGDTTVLKELGRHLFSAGQEQGETARLAFEAWLRVDPLAPLNWAQAAWRHFTAGRVAETVRAARRMLELTEPGNAMRTYAAYYLACANERDDAIEAFEEVGLALSGTPYGSLSLFFSRALQRDREGAIARVTPQLEQAAFWTEYLGLMLADGYAMIGCRDDAIRWLSTTVNRGFINYPYLAKHDPFLESLRGDLEFENLLQRVRGRWEAIRL